MATRSEIRERCIRMAFKRDDKEDELNDAINDTLAEMISIAEPRKMQDQVFVPTVALQEDYALPSNLLRIRHPIRLIDPDTNTNNSASHHQLRFISKVEYDFWEPNPNATTVIGGRPWAYTIWKNCILLTDVPDKVYRLEMNIGKLSVLLSADGDLMIFQDHWLETVCAGVLSRAFVGVKRYTDAKAWKEIYMNGYVGAEFPGGLKLIKTAERDVQEAPLIVKNNNL